MFEIIDQTKETFTYFFSETMIRNMIAKGRESYLGQEQKYFLLKFKGEDKDITLIPNQSNVKREFSEFEWVLPSELYSISPVKKEIYTRVLKQFNLI